MATIDRWTGQDPGLPVVRQPTPGPGMAVAGEALARAGLGAMQDITQERQRAEIEARQRAEQAQQQRDTLAAERLTAETEGWAGPAFDAIANAAPEGGEGVEEQVAEMWQQKRQQLLADASQMSPYARELLSVRLDGRVGKWLQGKAADFATGSRVAKQISDFDTILFARANRVISNPLSHDAEADDMAGLLTHLNIPAAKLSGVAQKVRSTLAQAAVSGQIDRDPATALRWLDGGRFDKALSPDEKVRLRNGAEGALRTREVEARQTAAVARAEMRADIADMQTALRTGRMVDYDPPRIMAVMGEKDGRAALDALAQAGRYGADAAAIRYASPDEIADIMAQRRQGQAANDIRGFADRQQEMASLARMVAERNRDLAEDPAGYVAASPVVGQRLQAVAEAENNPDNRAAIKEAWGTQIVASLSEQERLGVPEARRRVLSKSAAAGIVAEFQSPGTMAEPLAKRMAGLQYRYGDHWHRAFAELVDAGLPPGMFLLGTMTENGQEAARAALSEALMTGDKALRALVKPDELTLLRAAVQKRMEPYVATSQTERGRADAAQLSQGVETLALYYMSSGTTAEDAATRAYEAVGAQYTLTDTYRIPARYNPDAIEDAADAALSALSKADAPSSRYGDIWANQASSYLRQVRRNGYWINTADDKGLRLMDPMGRSVTVDGQPVILSFDDVMP